MFYKALDEDGCSCNGGSGQWSLPRDGGPGEWMPAIEGTLVPCKNGYHLCEDAQVLDWLDVRIFEAEYRGEMIRYDDKIVVREARLVREFLEWNEGNARLFACDCAERVLPLFECVFADDARPREAIAVARCFAAGTATELELSAAEAAASTAARSAARFAAWSAAWSVAWSAARSVARSAVGTTWDAAGDTEREWQWRRLQEILG